MKNHQSPKISIGIPVYNGERFLEKKISSLLELGYDNCEIIISDNGSTDKTKEICEKFKNQYKSLKLFRTEKNLGPNWNFQFILDNAVGEYFMWTSVDDIILDGFIEKNIHILEKKSSVVCSSSQVKPYGEKTSYINSNQKYYLSKIKQKIIRKFTPLKNYSTNNTYEKNVGKYMKIRGHQQIFYGIYRTEELREFFVSSFVTGFDFATMINALKFGNFYVLDEVLNLRYDGGLSSSGFFNYGKSLKINFFQLITMYYPFTKWCWNNLDHKLFLQNFDSILKINLEAIFYFSVDIIRRMGLGVLVNPKNE